MDIKSLQLLFSHWGLLHVAIQLMPGTATDIEVCVSIFPRSCAVYNLHN